MTQDHPRQRIGIESDSIMHECSMVHACVLGVGLDWSVRLPKTLAHPWIRERNCSDCKSMKAPARSKHGKGRIIQATAWEHWKTWELAWVITVRTVESKKLVMQLLVAGSSTRMRGINRTGKHTERRARSSPLTRWNRTSHPWTMCTPWLIPAQAGKFQGRVRTDLRSLAHPRAGVETSRRNPGPQHGSGSSPSMRGELTSDPALRLRPRLIPAHAGKKGIRTRSQCLDMAHPRARVGFALAAAISKIGQVSSRSTQGTPSRHRSALAWLRVIPAHAVGMHRRTFLTSFFPAHHRACTMDIMWAKTCGRGAGLIPSHAWLIPRARMGKIVRQFSSR